MFTKVDWAAFRPKYEKCTERVLPDGKLEVTCERFGIVHAVLVYGNGAPADAAADCVVIR